MFRKVLTMFQRFRRPEPRMTIDAEREENRRREAEEIEKRLHQVAARVHVLEWQVPPPRQDYKNFGGKE